MVKALVFEIQSPRFDSGPTDAVTGKRTRKESNYITGPLIGDFRVQAKNWLIGSAHTRNVCWFSPSYLRGEWVWFQAQTRRDHQIFKFLPSFWAQLLIRPFPKISKNNVFRGKSFNEEEREKGKTFCWIFPVQNMWESGEERKHFGRFFVQGCEIFFAKAW